MSAHALAWHFGAGAELAHGDGRQVVPAEWLEVELVRGTLIPITIGG